MLRIEIFSISPRCSSGFLLIFYMNTFSFFSPFSLSIVKSAQTKSGFQTMSHHYHHPSPHSPFPISISSPLDRRTKQPLNLQFASLSRISKWILFFFSPFSSLFVFFFYQSEFIFLDDDNNSLVLYYSYICRFIV